MDGRFIMTHADDSLYQHLRRRPDGTPDLEFYRRRAEKLRSEEFAKHLVVAWAAMRGCAASARALIGRGSQSILTASREAAAPPLVRREAVDAARK
jgi:hypothetical protein